jgi:hypothetical protein
MIHNNRSRPLSSNSTPAIYTTASLPEFFREQVEGAVQRQKLELNDATTHYLSNLLHVFSRSEELFQNDDRTLAELFLKSTQEMPQAQRIQLLRRVGDVALYISGFFSDSLNRKLVDVDYYMNMGGNAYHSLTGIVRDNLFVELYSEMANKFYDLVEVLSIISEDRKFTNNEDLLRLYERWMRTGSDRLYSKLIDNGIIPSTDSSTDKQS